MAAAHKEAPAPTSKHKNNPIKSQWEGV